ncbi:MAG: hypothetical protein QOH16_540 [Gaiellaceae bacterium]|nr:hypothetical protein [Gaiellaceae bacterium]
MLASVRAFLRQALRRARGTAVPLADPASLDHAARRTRVVRLLLAATLLAALVVAFLVAPRTPGRRFLPADATGIVVLDLSSSIKPDTYFRIEQTLATIAASQSRLGLVIVSDVAYEALPPGTAAQELKPMLRFFAPQSTAAGASAQLARSPWDQWFSAGTRISSGLFLAAHMLQQEHVKKSAVMLISDLADDPTDLTRLTDAVLLLQQRQVPLEIVGLDPNPANADFFKRLLGTDAIFQEAHLPTGAQARGQLEVTGTFPTALAVFAAFVIALLALNEWWAEPLRWQRRTA